VPERVLAGDGWRLVGDLGGLPTDDGGETRFGRVVRSDSVAELSEAGWRALVDYGIATILDLRFAEEHLADPPRPFPVEVVHLSLFGERDEAYWRELDRRAEAAGDHTASALLVYRDTLERNGAELAAAIRVVAEAAPGGVVVHCVGGKDRTALVSALLLRLAGVPVAAIADDYASSGEHLAPRHDRWFAEARDEAERERFRRIAATPAAAMASLLEEVDRRHGSAAGYLRAAGADDATLERARARLRG
jgi:protein tyrosine/serine phosphatase